MPSVSLGTNRGGRRSGLTEKSTFPVVPGSYGYRVEPDESAWNSALRAWFFREDLAGRPSYLAVDEETLAAIAREHDFAVSDPTESLRRVVQYRVTPRAPLRWWVNKASRWRLARRS